MLNVIAIVLLILVTVSCRLEILDIMNSLIGHSPFLLEFVIDFFVESYVRTLDIIFRS